MKGLNILFVCGVLFGFAWAESRVADAAEIYGGYRRIQPMRVQPHREAAVAMTACGWRCRAPCPDGYSCYPLYGGYRMPYGSPAYWSRYTMSGWWTPY